MSHDSMGNRIKRQTVSESKKHDKGKRHDTNLAPNVGLKNKCGDYICEQLGED